MDTKEIRCPSGMRGRIRKLLGRDFHALSESDEEESTPDIMAGLAESVWVETIDPGPYQFGTGKPMFRSDVLIGDRSHILIQSRILTDGGKKSNRIQCPGCEVWFPDLFDYNDLNIREWPDKDAPEPVDEMALKAYMARRRFAAKEPCSTVMPDKTEIQWNLLTGNLLQGSIKDFALQFGGGTYSEMAARVHSISDLDLDSIDKPEDRRAAVFKRLNGGYTDTELWGLWDDIQDHECGPDTDVRKQCPSPRCGHKFGYVTDTVGFIIPAPRMRSMRSRGGARTRGM